MSERKSEFTKEKIDRNKYIHLGGWGKTGLPLGQILVNQCDKNVIDQRKNKIHTDERQNIKNNIKFKKTYDVTRF